MCVRNGKGGFVAAKTMNFEGIPTSQKAEATGAFEAIWWLKELGVQRVTIELDCYLVINGINGGNYLMTMEVCSY